MLPGAWVRLYEAFRAGRALGSEDLGRRLAAFRAQTSGRSGGAGVKTAMDLAGPLGGADRPYPLEPRSGRRCPEENGLAE